MRAEKFLIHHLIQYLLLSDVYIKIYRQLRIYSINIMTLKKNISELNVIKKIGSKANIDKITHFIYVYVDRKIVNF